MSVLILGGCRPPAGAPRPLHPPTLPLSGQRRLYIWIQRESCVTAPPLFVYWSERWPHGERMWDSLRCEVSMKGQILWYLIRIITEHGFKIRWINKIKQVGSSSIALVDVIEMLNVGRAAPTLSEAAAAPGCFEVDLRVREQILIQSAASSSQLTSRISFKIRDTYWL